MSVCHRLSHMYKILHIILNDAFNKGFVYFTCVYKISTFREIFAPVSFFLFYLIIFFFFFASCRFFWTTSDIRWLKHRDNLSQTCLRRNKHGAKTTLNMIIAWFPLPPPFKNDFYLHVYMDDRCKASFQYILRRHYRITCRM